MVNHDAVAADGPAARVAPQLESLARVDPTDFWDRHNASHGVNAPSELVGHTENGVLSGAPSAAVHGVALAAQELAATRAVVSGRGALVADPR
jgi:hypothetical protein